VGFRRYRHWPTLGNSQIRENGKHAFQRFLVRPHFVARHSGAVEALTCWALIPVKPPPDRKSRLSGTLAPDARDALVMRMATHVADAAARTTGIDHVAFVAPDAAGLPEGALVLPDPEDGLNGAVTSACREIFARGATRVIVIHGDLPLVTPAELAPLAQVPAATIAMAPDRHGIGTNALSLPLPDAAQFAFLFGPDSFARHHAEARRLGLATIEVRSEGLARDVDEPADLADAAALIGAVP
jgi:2-phospho-L-lactate guanylyltransferase